jgi:uncharacterized membrane protein
MLLLIVGLVVFLGIHSVRILAPEWRDAQREDSVRAGGKGSILSRRWRGSFSWCGATRAPGQLLRCFTSRRFS